MDQHRKNERVSLLRALGNEVHAETLKLHVLAGGDPQEIVFDEDKLVQVVDEYDRHLEDYRQKHIGSGNLVDGDKIAAMTGILIVRHNVFRSATRVISTRYAAMVNAIFAVRTSQVFVRRIMAGYIPAEKKQLLYCFANCYDNDNAMVTWAVATMQKHIYWGSTKETPVSD